MQLAPRLLTLCLFLDSPPQTAATEGALGTGLDGEEDLGTTKSEAKEKLFIDVRKELHLERSVLLTVAIRSHPNLQNPHAPKRALRPTGLTFPSWLGFTPDLVTRPAF